MNVGAGMLINRLRTSREMTRRTRSRSLTTTMPNLRDIAVDSSLVMLAFLNTDQRCTRIGFGEPLGLSFKNDVIPTPLLELLRYMNEEGVDIPDVFRRPGNTTEQKKLIKKLTDGKAVTFSDYNFYTLASVIKRFLLCIPGGILGLELENKALTVLYMEDMVQQLQTLHRIITCLPRPVQRLLSLLFGLWYRIAQHEHIHKMSVEAMAKSVTGSIFVNTTSDPRLVKNAAKVMELFIANFSCPLLFGEENLEFFCDMTSTTDLSKEACDAVHERTNHHLQDGVHLSTNDSNRPDKKASLPREEEIRVRQLDRLKQRADWFLSNHRSAENSPSAIRRHNPRAYLSRQTIDVITHCHSNGMEADTASNSSSNTEEDHT